MSKQSDLRVREMRIIWRDTFIVHHPLPDFLEASRTRLARMGAYRADRFSKRDKQPSELRTFEAISRSVSSLGYDDILRFQFADFEFSELRPALKQHRTQPHRLSEAQIIDHAARSDKRSEWIKVTPMLLLHRAGAGIMQYHVSFSPLDDDDLGMTTDEAIQLVRLGIQPQLLGLSRVWRDMLPDDLEAAGITPFVELRANWNLAVMGLRDISWLIAARLDGEYPDTLSKKNRLRNKQIARRMEIIAETARPTGSASVILVETTPAARRDFAPFIAEYAAPLRGIGAMDTLFRERSDWLVERELQENLSADAEMAFYLLGQTELAIFNDRAPRVRAEIERRRHFDSDRANITIYAHYVLLMEWIFLQNALLRHYLRQLDALVAAESPDRRQMISTLQGALSNLIQYQSDITPYTSRIEFLERARAYHKLDKMEERFERKQELVLDYAEEFHDYREARASEFLNWLAGILTGAALADLIIVLVGISVEQTVLYLGINAASIVLVLAIMAVILRRR